MPATTPALPCPVAEIDLYRILELNRLHPELRAEQDKKIRKALRLSGYAPNSFNQSYSNIRILPVKAQCASGKLDGNLEFLVSYDSVTLNNSSLSSGDRTINSTMTTSSHEETRIFTSAVAGVPSKASTRLTRRVVTSDTKYDDAAMQAEHESNNKSLGLNKPKRSFSAAYTGTNGEMQMYTGNQLMLSGNVVGGELHGEVIFYSDNYLKKNNLRLDQQVGMENAREVTMNGVDLIATRTCYQHGVAVKISPCPAQ